MSVIIHFYQGCPSLPVIFTDPQYLDLIPYLLKGMNSFKFCLGYLHFGRGYFKFSAVGSQFLN